MIVTKILGNVHVPSDQTLLAGRHVEKVTLSSADLVKRIQRLHTDHGHELGLRLPAQAPDLKDGDIVMIDDSGEQGNAVVVQVLPTDVLVITAHSIQDMAFVAHSLGNRHLQAQFFGKDSEYEAEVMVVQYDHTVQDFLDHHGVPYSRQERVMPVPFRHSEHTH
ncbi:urease accessory protein UreE [Kocuria sp. cx-455]|uniref:urease accessory protein UreE n=1 Tax=Kocuria sp. cx-455 TaxID=2771377 RepID=UPI0016856BD3|nr:urease accessory protein UreE [Kocuria sp. cx-455]MBD2765735.1 urease accessory protein UreE [Kocuria sp. cx-455]